MNDANVANTGSENESEWNAQRKELVKKTCCPTDITDIELQHFADWCRRSGLDPMRGDCMLQERRSKEKINGQETGKWIRKLSPMATEAGMSRRAAEFPDYRGVLSAAVYEGDTVEFDHVNGKVVHTSSPLKRGRLIGAWAKVLRDGMTFPIEWCPLAGFAQSNPMWETKGETMIVKCARTAAQRRAFPGPFSGVYSIEEPITVQRADLDADATGEVALKTQSEIAKEKVSAHLRAASPAPALSADNGGRTVDEFAFDVATEKLMPVVATGAPTPEEVRAAEAAQSGDLPPAPPTPPPSKGGAFFSGLKILFGEHKNKLASTLTPPQLLETIGYVNGNLAKATGKEPWYLKAKGNLADMRTLYVQASSAKDPSLNPLPPVVTAPSREPGEEG